MAKVKKYQKEESKDIVRYKFWLRINKRALKIGLLSFGALIVILLLAFGGYSVAYAKKTFHNVKVGNIDFSGKNKSDIANILNDQSEKFLSSDITLNYQDGDKQYQIQPSDIGLSFDLDKTAGDIYGYGRNDGVLHDFWNQLKSVFATQKIPMEYTINQDALNKKIADIATEVDNPEKDFRLSYEGGGQYTLLTDRAAGQRINQQNIIANITSHITGLKSDTINFKSDVFEPQISEENANKGLAAANKILVAGALGLTYGTQTFSLDVDTIAGMIASRPDGKKMKIYIDHLKLKKQVDGLAAQIDADPVNAQFSATNGSVGIFVPSENGEKLDRDKASIDIEGALLARGGGVTSKSAEPVVLKVVATKPEVDSTELSKYGINELVASGTTSFSGSPSNRVHNITVGMNAISGVLIKPGEEFSTLNRLGKIDASTGYLPELVIKDNKTVPDYGGGLCQVSTTLFRAALNAGMKITARQNHSYRVSYYEPPVGMDATIYDPAPDFKFINNYNSYILVQGKVTGSKITFEFYGTKDARLVEIGTPSVYDVIQPAAPLEIPTDTLAPGERKLIDHSHLGSSASFHYKVSLNGTIMQETDFVSKYVPWQEKWLVGITPAAPAPEPAPTPTPDPAPVPVPTP